MVALLKPHEMTWNYIAQWLYVWIKNCALINFVFIVSVITYVYARLSIYFCVLFFFYFSFSFVTYFFFLPPHSLSPMYLSLCLFFSRSLSFYVSLSLGCEFSVFFFSCVPAKGIGAKTRRQKT